MTALTDQETSWIAEVAGRLRLIQADGSAVTPQQRREYLVEEINRSLKPVRPADRKRFLEALVARFPVGGEAIALVAAPAAPSPPPPPETFEDILHRLLETAPGISEARRNEAIRRLSGAGLVPAPTPTAPAAPATADVGPELRQGLGLPADAAIRQDRLVQLVLMIVDVIHRLDQMTVATMREAAPKSALAKRAQSFREAATQFLVKEEQTIEPQARLLVDSLAALLKAFADGGRDFGIKYVQQMSPSAIRDVVLAEGKRSLIPGLGKNTEELCWAKYGLLAREYETPDKVNQRIRESLATFIEQKVLRGR